MEEGTDLEFARNVTNGICVKKIRTVVIFSRFVLIRGVKWVKRCYILNKVQNVLTEFFF